MLPYIMISAHIFQVRPSSFRDVFRMPTLIPKIEIRGCHFCFKVEKSGRGEGFAPDVRAIARIAAGGAYLNFEILFNGAKHSPLRPKTENRGLDEDLWYFHMFTQI